MFRSIRIEYHAAAYPFSGPFDLNLFVTAYVVSNLAAQGVEREMAFLF